MERRGQLSELAYILMVYMYTTKALAENRSDIIILVALNQHSQCIRIRDVIMDKYCLIILTDPGPVPWFGKYKY